MRKRIKPEKLRVDVAPGTLERIEQFRMRLADTTKGLDITLDTAVNVMLDNAFKLVCGAADGMLVSVFDNTLCSDAPLARLDHFIVAPDRSKVRWRIAPAKDGSRPGSIEVMLTAGPSLAIHPNVSNVVTLTPAERL